jgi:hypothetical protein
MDFLSFSKSLHAAFRVYPGRRVFIQDSDRPATGFFPIYSHHRKGSAKSEKTLKDFGLLSFYLSDFAWE